MLRLNTILAICFVGLLCILLFQVQWLEQSRAQLSEQFDQKVSKALCLAVSNLNEVNPNISCRRTSNGCSSGLTRSDEQAFRTALREAMAFYDIYTSFEFLVTSREDAALDEKSPYCCSLQPFNRDKNELLQVSFPDKPMYIIRELGVMLAASILLLLIVTFGFGAAYYALIQQKRISARNKEVFNNMAHELKTPLTNLNLAGKLLRREYVELKDDRLFSVIETETEQLTEQVERILYLAKLEHCDYEIEKTVTDVGEIVQQVLKSMHARITARQAEVEVQVPTALFVEVDVFHFSNALRNLLDNALKYCREQPKIQIQVQQTTEGIRFAVEDNGVGISKTNQAFVFDQYQRFSEGNLYTTKGVGLGLSYVKKVVELHKGFIRIVSELGEGSRFEMVLPA